jgi:hypothetical protein
MPRLISSQSFLDESIVCEKRDRGIYTATYVVVTVGGEVFWVIADGHHRIAAAKADGVDVEWERADASDWGQTAEEILGNLYNDCDWYDTATGKPVW